LRQCNGSGAEELRIIVLQSYWDLGALLRAVILGAAERTYWVRDDLLGQVRDFLLGDTEREVSGREGIDMH